MATLTSSSLSAAVAPRLLSAHRSFAPASAPAAAPRSTRLAVRAVAVPAAPESSFAAPPVVPDLALEEEPAVPTPVLPSGPMMAQFLVHLRQTVEHYAPSGDAVATGIENVLERVRVGCTGLVHHPSHGASPLAGERWHAEELALESCLAELEKDARMLRAYRGKAPNRLALALVGAHCSEAARLLNRL